MTPPRHLKFPHPISHFAPAPLAPVLASPRAAEPRLQVAKAAERSIEICKSLIDLSNIDRSFMGYQPRDVKVCFDEWNVWDESKAPGAVGLEQWYDYTDMLGFCAWLNVLVRKHKDIGIACLAQSVNVISPLMTRPDGIGKQTTYYP
jgi:alpha-N-arabinofuranosidase